MKSDFDARQRGVLLHLTSLPSAYGIGGLGKEAYEFADYLKNHGYAYWQILPLNYPGHGNSPYNPISSFAGNPWLIDPAKLYEQGLISKIQLSDAEIHNNGKINFKQVNKKKTKLLLDAFIKFINSSFKDDLMQFLETEGDWLKPFVMYSLLKSHYHNKPWQKWKAEHRQYSGEHLENMLATKMNYPLFPVFLQYIFDRQLRDLKQYINSQGIQIIGDMPLYVSLDSSDVWSRQDLFELDEYGYPKKVAGVPPDAFSETGQLWGNPLYRWDKMQEENFDWWKRRLEKTFVFADKLRLDHFIGLVNYWAIDAKVKSAINGSWFPGPKHAFFDAILQDFPQESFIAEDLGILTDEVNNLRAHYGFPGMIILQFCFEHDRNDILSFPPERIIFTGTHDNHTTLGWYRFNQKHNKPDNQNLENYLHKVGMLPVTEKLTEYNICELMINLAKASPSYLSIVPMQDILGLDDQARMNIPGKALSNWHWRMQ